MRGAKGQPNLEAFEDRHQASYLDGRQYHGRLGLVVASWSFGRGGILQMGGGEVNLQRVNSFSEVLQKGETPPLQQQLELSYFLFLPCL